MRSAEFNRIRRKRRGRRRRRKEWQLLDRIRQQQPFIQLFQCQLQLARFFVVVVVVIVAVLVEPVTSQQVPLTARSARDALSSHADNSTSFRFCSQDLLIEADIDGNGYVDSNNDEMYLLIDSMIPAKCKRENHDSTAAVLSSISEIVRCFCLQFVEYSQDRYCCDDSSVRLAIPNGTYYPEPSYSNKLCLVVNHALLLECSASDEPIGIVQPPSRTPNDEEENSTSSKDDSENMTSPGANIELNSANTSTDKDGIAVENTTKTYPPTGTPVTQATTKPTRGEPIPSIQPTVQPTYQPTAVPTTATRKPTSPDPVKATFPPTVGTTSNATTVPTVVTTSNATPVPVTTGNATTVPVTTGNATTGPVTTSNATTVPSIAIPSTSNATTVPSATVPTTAPTTVPSITAPTNTVPPTTFPTTTVPLTTVPSTMSTVAPSITPATSTTVSPTTASTVTSTVRVTTNTTTTTTNLTNSTDSNSTVAAVVTERDSNSTVQEQELSQQDPEPNDLIELFTSPLMISLIICCLIFLVMFMGTFFVEGHEKEVKLDGLDVALDPEEEDKPIV